MSSCAQQPSTTNVCTKYKIGDPRNVIDPLPGFCTVAGEGGDQFRSEYCGNIGDQEWGNPIQGALGSCSYNSCHEYQNFIGSDCCSTCCPVVGAQVSCSRIAYKGDPLTCCFNDYEAMPDDSDLCFETSTQQRTCNPIHRDITSSVGNAFDGGSCRNLTFDYCLGEDPKVSDEEWFSRWPAQDVREAQDVGEPGQKDCTYALKRNLFGHNWLHANFFNGNADTIPPHLYEELGWGTTMMNAILDKYVKAGYRIGALPGEPGYNEFQNTLFAICQKSPSLCADQLTKICSDSTIEDLSENPALVQWCGCYLSEDEYKPYAENFKVPRECTPVCARKGNIPLASASSTNLQTCTQSVCILDAVNAEITKSSPTQHNFNQVCGGCSSSFSNSNSSCTCYVVDDTSSEIDSKIVRDCDTTVHYKIDSDGEIERVYGREEETKCHKKSSFNFSTIALWILIIVAIILFVVFLAVIGSPQSKTIIKSSQTRTSIPTTYQHQTSTSFVSGPPLPHPTPHPTYYSVAQPPQTTFLKTPPTAPVVRAPLGEPWRQSGYINQQYTNQQYHNENYPSSIRSPSPSLPQTLPEPSSSFTSTSISTPPKSTIAEIPPFSTQLR